jgi:transcriptional regulator with GAF, ATPase, and Fis domain
MSDPAPIEPTPRPQISLVSAGSAEPYRRLAEIFHDVLSEQSLDALLERIADTLADLVPYEDVQIYEADEATRELIPVLARTKWADQVMSERFSFGEGITGWAAEHREPCSRTRRTSTRVSASSQARPSSQRRSSRSR